MDATPQVQQRVRDGLAAHGLLDGATRVYVGFSGGGDSTACLLLMRSLHPAVTAIHLHHGLRGAEADADEAWCRQFCEERRIPFESHALDVPTQRRKRESIEVAARRCRLEFWRSRVESGAVVALGHHADDCLEELLLRLARGANASGLTGLRPRRTVFGVRIIRPLLGLRRAELVEYLREQGISNWCEDLSNRDTTRRRNAVRHEWLPLLRQTVGHDLGLLHSLDALAHDAAFLEQAARDALERTSDPAQFRHLHPALLPRVLRLWLAAETGRDVLLSGSALNRLSAALRAGTGRPVCVPLGKGASVAVSRGRLHLLRDPAVLTARVWRWRETPRLELPEISATLTAEPVCGRDAADAAPPRLVEVFRRADVPDELTVRAWTPGDRMIPFGAHSPKKLQDLFVDAHVPRDERARVPVVLAGDTIIWAAGVRRAEFGRFQDSGTSVPGLCLRLT
ncbi:MAG: tRNA lysidine(34) synthetase TilS [Lentisphaerae bacterium RIFOXYB12_FULL_65_16]|nr:MAG: tRNA lysidine(34) synthetase TilS [Lentisphaerae bacterium RIFOXYA12_64_32]OGV84151.1 MAG: tRNA lysidine(34) synthetase TilS [Lentisphaerae bacterium RIFOXYB12_FULL_65_16]